MSGRGTEETSRCLRRHEGGKPFFSGYMINFCPSSNRLLGSLWFLLFLFLFLFSGHCQVDIHCHTARNRAIVSASYAGI